MHNTLIQLSLIENIGPATIAGLLRLVEQRSWQLSDLQKFTCADLMQLGLKQQLAETIVDGLGDTQALERELQRTQAIDAQIITLLDDTYPEQLRHIAYPPPVLYVRGNADILLQPSIAVVGARKADTYGLRAARQVVESYVGTEAVIVSGGARGIDAAAHKAALACGLPTVAVLGSGLYKPYPREHIALFDQIVGQGGVVITPFACTFEPLPGNFPARNRIISGLCQSVVIVQGEHKSGAAITAQFALDQGRQVYAIPGEIDNPLSALPHSLIHQGAEIWLQRKSETKEAAAVQPKPTVTLEDKIIEQCQIPRSTEELAELLQADHIEIFEKLFALQCAGKIEQNFIGLWQARS